MKLFKLSVVAAFIAQAQEMCVLPIDLMILQDTTGSFVDDLPNVSKNIPVIVQNVMASNPGSQFGASEHKDKPYRDLGDPSDFCYRLAAPLTSNATLFQNEYDTLYASGGGDLPEAQLHALIDLATDPLIGWRKVSIDPADKLLEENVGARVILLSTDAVFHDPGDYTLYLEDPLPNPPLPPSYMPVFPDNTNGISAATQCKVYDYPAPEQAATALKAANIKVLFLVPESETAAVAKWQDFNQNYLGQPAEFVQYIASDSSDIVNVVLASVNTVTKYVCEQTTTTVAPKTPTVSRTTLPQAATSTSTTHELSTSMTTTACDCVGQIDCECVPALVIRVNNKPSILHIDYQK